MNLAAQPEGATQPLPLPAELAERLAIQLAAVLVRDYRRRHEIEASRERRGA